VNRPDPDPPDIPPTFPGDPVPLPEEDPVFEGARRVVTRLREAGHEAWLVGGGVRDLLLGTVPKDWDVATSATPEQVQRLFPRNVPVGVQFGVVRVRLAGREYEVATFREDLGYTDGRRPDSVRFSGLAEDVRRRDFTINGMALDPVSGEVVDLVGGRADLQRRCIRAIGDPEQRFAEDHLRPLRAIRFAARTAFFIEPLTWEALVRVAATVATVSPERIAQEMERLLEAPHPGLGWTLLGRSGLLGVVLPEWRGSVEETAGVLDRLRGRPLPWLWAAALWPLGPGEAPKTLGRLRRSTALRDEVRDILATAQEIRGLPFGDVAAEKRLVRRPETPASVEVLEAWTASPGPVPEGVAHARDRLALWGPADLFPERLLDGHDLIRLGIPAGPAVARALRMLEDARLRGEVRDREEAVRMVARLAGTSLRKGTGEGPGGPR